MTVIEEVDETTQDSEGETYLRYYLKKRSMWINILLSLFILLNVISLFLLTNFSYTEVFGYFWSFLILFGFGLNVFNGLEENYFWALLISTFTGIIPLIELIVILAMKTFTGLDVIFICFTFVLVWTFAILPYAVIAAKTSNK